MVHYRSQLETHRTRFRFWLTPHGAHACSAASRHLWVSFQKNLNQRSNLPLQRFTPDDMFHFIILSDDWDLFISEYTNKGSWNQFPNSQPVRQALTSSSFMVTFCFKFVCLFVCFERDRENASRRGAEREGEFQAVSTHGKHRAWRGARTHVTVRSWLEPKSRVGCSSD